MENSALQRAGSSASAGGVALFFRYAGQCRCGLFDEASKFPQRSDGSRWNTLSAPVTRVVKQRQQQVLDGHELMTVLALWRKPAC